MRRITDRGGSSRRSIGPQAPFIPRAPRARRPNASKPRRAARRSPPGNPRARTPRRHTRAPEPESSRPEASRPLRRGSGILTTALGGVAEVGFFCWPAAALRCGSVPQPYRGPLPQAARAVGLGRLAAERLAAVRPGTTVAERPLERKGRALPEAGATTAQGRGAPASYFSGSRLARWCSPCASSRARSAAAAVAGLGPASPLRAASRSAESAAPSLVSIT